MLHVERMRGYVVLAMLAAGCVGPAPSGGNQAVDAGTTSDSNHPGDGAVAGACPLPGTTADTGTLTATAAQRCTVPGSMGQAHWFRLATTLPSGAMDYIQLELWDNTGAFAGTTVHTGTFQITGVETDYQTCGVCVRGLGDKGSTGQKEYFATSGTVTVTAVGAGGTPISATVSNIGFVEIDATMHKPVAGGCTANVARAQVDGTVTDVGGNGGGGGQCPAGVGD